MEEKEYKKNEENKQEEVVVETRTLEQLLEDLRKEKNWTYMHVVENLYKIGVTTDEKTVKKWEIGLVYPDIDMIYKLSELYMVSSENFIMAKTNSYNNGMQSVHMTFIKYFCYITGLSFKVAYFLIYAFLGFGLIYAFLFFLSCADMFMQSRPH